MKIKSTIIAAAVASLFSVTAQASVIWGNSASGGNVNLRFPRFFVFQEVGFMLSVSLSVE